MAAFSRAETLALSRFAVDCATSVSMANTSFKSRSYSSAQMPASVRASTNCAFTCTFPPERRTVPSSTWENTQRITDLVYVLLAAILHDAGAADDLEVSDFRQLDQNVVLHAVGKEPVLFLFA